MFNLFFAVLALIAGSVHIAASPRKREHIRNSLHLSHLLAFYLPRLDGVFTAYAHAFQSLQTSASIGWSPSPYEYEVGMADLTVGVLGIMCIRIRGNFWLATAIANAVWLLRDSIGHVYQMEACHGHARNNSGVSLASEIIAPIVLLAL